MSMAEYMALCLGHPTHGYYQARQPFGQAGDFTTAPEISQMFGEMIGLWMAQVWQDQGSPKGALVELGPGRGTLMADLRRATRALGEFAHALPIHLVETSLSLREAQRGTLGEEPTTWHASLDEIPDGPLFLVANEFFDALPIRQFMRDGNGWRERVVGLEDEALRLGLGPTADMAGLDQRFPDVAEGTIVEICEAAEAIASDIAVRIEARGGAAIMIDYGSWEGTGDTFQALEDHSMVDPLAAPGRADLTTHVAFGALAKSNRLRVSFDTQGAFLERLGITARARALADGQHADAIASQHRRLTHPEEMGTLFKVLALTPEIAPPPPGFA